MNTVAIIQVRERSTRLPNKALADIEGKPMLQRVIDRVSRSHWVDRVVVATTVSSPQIIAYCKDNNIEHIAYEGDEDDIVGRTGVAAGACVADTIIRIWGDCPLIDPRIIDLVVNDHMSYGYDYTYNIGYPKGLNCAVMSFELLNAIWEEFTGDDRQFFQRRLCKQGLARAVPYYKDLSSISWCVDDRQDLDYVRKVYQDLGEFALMDEILEHWYKHHA